MLYKDKYTAYKCKITNVQGLNTVPGCKLCCPERAFVSSFRTAP